MKTTPPYRYLAISVALAILAVAGLPLDAPLTVAAATLVGFAFGLVVAGPGRSAVLLKRAALVSPFLILLAVFQLWRPITEDTIVVAGIACPAGPVRAVVFLLKTITAALIGLAWGDRVGADGIARTIQRFRLPAGAVATTYLATNFMGTLRHEWDSVRLAAAARGLNHAPWRFQFRQLGGTMVSVLVRSLRRGDRVALAMRARGYRGQLPAPLRSRTLVIAREHVAFLLTAALATLAIGARV